MTGRMRHPAFVPPYLLRTLASGDTPVAADAARTLRLDGEFRRRRAAPGEEATVPDLPGDDGAGPSRGIFDAEQAQTLPGRPVRLEGRPATGDPAADEAYDGLGATWRLFSEAFGRDSLDGHGAPLVGSVHYGRGYDNAFWNGSQLVFGDGDGVIFNRFTIALDVIGHELAHAVTERMAGLIYSDQSGALNESVSDVFGSLVKQRELGQTADEADWLIGSGLLLPGVQGTAIRSMSQPGTAYDDPRLGKDPQPDSMAGYVRTRSDNGGVHLNSGIPNRAFYLAATALGGPAWERAGRVWYDTLRGPIKPDCDFATFARLTIEAAMARFGPGAEADAVRAAWATVGVLGDPSAAPSDRARPASGELVVTRSGGFAGVQQTRTVDLSALPTAERRAWGAALRDRGLADPADADPWPDAFCYEITCTHPELDVQLPEQALPPGLRTLLTGLWADA